MPVPPATVTHMMQPNTDVNSATAPADGAGRPGALNIVILTMRRLPAIFDLKPGLSVRVMSHGHSRSRLPGPGSRSDSDSTRDRSRCTQYTGSEQCRHRRRAADGHGVTVTVTVAQVSWRPRHLVVP
jgi:hypothetical protein